MLHLVPLLSIFIAETLRRMQVRARSAVCGGRKTTEAPRSRRQENLHARQTPKCGRRVQALARQINLPHTRLAVL